MTNWQNWFLVSISFFFVFKEELFADDPKLVVANWNVENLFDSDDDPNNEGDDSYTPKGWRHWSEKRYHLKLDHLATVVAAMKPDILCLEEIENLKVLKDLSSILVSKHQLPMTNIVHRDSTDVRGIDCAILSTLPVTKKEWYIPETGQRDVVVADFKRGNRPITIVVNHWKSKLGKKEVSDALRGKCAKTVRKILDVRLKKNQDAAIVVTGDFNSSPDSKFVTEIAGMVSDREKVLKDPDGKLFYFVGASLPKEKQSSYYYAAADEWSALDQIHVSKGLLTGSSPWKVVEKSYEVFKFPEQVWMKGYPRPFRRIRRKSIGDFYVTGYSDHFPVRVELVPGK